MSLRKNVLMRQFFIGHAYISIELRVVVIQNASTMPYRDGAGEASMGEDQIYQICGDGKVSAWEGQIYQKGYWT